MTLPPPLSLPPAPPYALAPATFRFAGLANLAGRAPLGGMREVAIATYVAVRLAHDVLAARGLSQPTRAERAAQARSWLANVALPQTVRPALAKLIDTTAADPATVAPAVRVVIEVTASYVDRASALELDQLARVLEEERASA